ncbi:YbaB/EbfC family nucleoid-associated protein [Glycomyces buryatensis]|uniref:YbaB/EbfC family nucleoid-associated protein n=1 Tax=Glycomyces buryatensis TaxID=2570927 RepID=A0A4S8Q2K0_9ACTN|nr:YbaB/EbfC family nucleoid-associated protein [Glycomyces buryatensis]THV34374.1 YbaB/EbfC family nucleoid-associated protein [Glycomyces buryatensis]
MTDRNQSRPDPEAMMARLEQMERDAKATLEKYENLRAQAEAEAVEVTSEDGLLRVKLNADGKVTELGIDERAMRRRQTLGPAIIELIDTAKARHAERMTRMAQEMLGDDLDLSAILNRIQQQ